MSKRSLVTLLIFIVLGILAGVLFGAMFVLRDQTVVVKGETPVNISRDELISLAGLNSGSSIFMLDKEQAIKNIEDKYSHIKVIQIKTTSVTKVEIVVRARHEMFYTEYNNNYYVMDEELKILNIYAVSSQGEQSNKPSNLIQLTAKTSEGENNLNINASTLKCDFVGTREQRDCIKKIYESLPNNIKEINGEEKVYYSRVDFLDMFKEIKLIEYATFNKAVISTKYGVSLDIENPRKNMTDKMNICLSTIKALINENNQREESGTIKIFYNLDGEQKNVYIEANN